MGRYKLRSGFMMLGISVGVAVTWWSRSARRRAEDPRHRAPALRRLAVHHRPAGGGPMRGPRGGGATDPGRHRGRGARGSRASRSGTPSRCVARPGACARRWRRHRRGSSASRSASSGSGTAASRAASSSTPRRWRARRAWPSSARPWPGSSSAARTRSAREMLIGSVAFSGGVGILERFGGTSTGWTATTRSWCRSRRHAPPQERRHRPRGEGPRPGPGARSRTLRARWSASCAKRHDLSRPAQRLRPDHRDRSAGHGGQDPARAVPRARLVAVGHPGGRRGGGGEPSAGLGEPADGRDRPAPRGGGAACGRRPAVPARDRGDHARRRHRRGPSPAAGSPGWWRTASCRGFSWPAVVLGLAAAVVTGLLAGVAPGEAGGAPGARRRAAVMRLRRRHVGFAGASSRRSAPSSPTGCGPRWCWPAWRPEWSGSRSAPWARGRRARWSARSKRKTIVGWCGRPPRGGSRAARRCGAR